jgi:hemolysin III
MAMQPAPQIQSSREETVNSIIHLAGFVLSLGAVSTLIVLASMKGTARHIVSCSIYGGTLIFLYLSSTLYHSLSEGRAKRLFHLFDHSSIFLLIAGTYTPFTLVTLRGRWGWCLFGTIWGLALAGILMRVLINKNYPVISTVIFLLMGWLIVLAIKPLVARLPSIGLEWLVAGGLFYTTGVIFFGLVRFRYSHAVWHFFVLAGSLCHFFAIIFTLPPR